jgi:hypothetical protein
MNIDGNGDGEVLFGLVKDLLTLMTSLMTHLIMFELAYAIRRAISKVQRLGNGCGEGHTAKQQG